MEVRQAFSMRSGYWEKATGQSLVRQRTGPTVPPTIGDLLVYAKEYLGTGHVAVLTQVDTKCVTLRVAEQNYLNRDWPGSYAQEIKLVRRDGRWWVRGPYLLGWKRAAEALPACRWIGLRESGFRQELL